MPRKIKIPLIICASILVLSMAFAAGCILPVSSSATPTSGPNTALVKEAWDTLTTKYVVPAKADQATLNAGAVRGMVDSLNDPYSAYFNADEYKLENSSFQGSFGGIGAQVGLNKDNQPVILSPIPGAPAEKAGIQTGDIILAVDGKSTQGLSVTETVMLVRGQPGTTVKLLIQHPGTTAPVEISIVRAQISSPSVTAQMKGSIVYIKITSFTQVTNDELGKAFSTLDLKNATGIIIDLRDNPGGIVTTVVDVASHFIKQGVIITLRDNQGHTTSDSANPNGVFTDLPMVVLVNQFSASGSEVLSGALQDYKRATIAGTVTLGKGSYDSFFQLSDGSAIYLTIGRWITPNGREIEGKGITPDYTLTQTGDDEIQWAIDYLNKPK